MVVGETTIKGPVPSGVPPHVPLYQCQSAPALNVPFTFSVVVEPEHIVEKVAVADVGAAGIVQGMYLAHK